MSHRSKVKIHSGILLDGEIQGSKNTLKISVIETTPMGFFSSFTTQILFFKKKGDHLIH